jgi:hypothetical protein
MPIDYDGTTPGLVAKTEEPPQVHIKCRNETCDSILAIEIKMGQQSSGSRRLYQCVKCKATRSVPVGGSVEFG